MANRIEWYNQEKAFYIKALSGEHEYRSTHSSLYFFLLHYNNLCLWQEWFKCPHHIIMQGAFIGSKKTYYSALNDLVEFGLIKYEKGVNSYQAPKFMIIPLVYNNNIHNDTPVAIEKEEIKTEE